MSIKTNLNIAPYFDDYDLTKKYYRVLFKPGFAVQARELNQLQATFQNQIEQFGENIYKEGSIIKGSTFSELQNLKFVKVVDNIVPETAGTDYTSPEVFAEKTVINGDFIDEYYYEIEDEDGLKALVVQGITGFQSRDPDLNTFFVVYLNTTDSDKKEYEANDTLEIREYILRTDANGDETTIDNGIVATTSVTSLANPVGDSFGLNASEGIIFQRGHFLFVDDQTIIVEKYLTSETSVIKPDSVSIGYVVDENIITSQQDATLLDNANGSPNENAPGADRLILVPRLVSRPTSEAENDSEFFILRRYENGEAVQTRDVSEFNSIAREFARRTYETHGDYTKKPFEYKIIERNNGYALEMSEGVAYSKGYRISNDSKRIFDIPEITNTEVAQNQPFNINYGGYVKVLGATGRVDIGTMQVVDLYDSDSPRVKIGTAIVKNYTPDRLYLFAIRMNTGRSFDEVEIVREDSKGDIQIGDFSDSQNIIRPKMINSSKSTMVFDFNRSFVKSVDDITFSIRESLVDDTSANGNIIITPESGYQFNSDTTKDLLIIDNTTNLEVGVVSTELLGNGNLVIDTDLTDSRSITVYHNSNIISATPKVKNVFEIYVKTEYSLLKSKYTLGLPDCISIVSILDESSVDFTSSFKLVRNQKDDFYDHSYIEKIPGTPTPADEELTVLVKVFKVDSGSNLNFFTIDSYTNVDIKDIPYFETTDGNVINLTNSVDFRPYRTPLASYAETAGAATVLTVQDPTFTDPDVELFPTGINYAIPAINTSGTLDVEYYDSRIDYIVASSYGRFKYIVGNEVGNSVGRIDTNENTIVAEILIPGFPLLTKEEAFRLNRAAETISVAARTVKTYTMKDIEKISDKIDRLEYYTSLSILERSASDLVIQDENGLNRFKNGIIVDNFSDMLTADINDANFNSSVDFSEKVLYPSIKQFPLDLRVKSYANTQSYDSKNSVVSLTSDSSVKFLSQQYATTSRSCTSNVYNYKAVGLLTPEYDVAYDTVTTPISLEVDLATPFSQFSDSLSEFINLTSTQTNLLSTSVQRNTTTTRRRKHFNFNRKRKTTETITTNNYEDVFRELSVTDGEPQEEFVGDFITNSTFKPFMKSREIQVEFYGLRPNTRHYFFFDETDVNASVAPGISTADETSGIPGVLDPTRVAKSGSYGAVIRSNNNGELFAIFKLPASTFFVGERELVVADVTTFGEIESSAASIGKLKYNAYNFNVEKAGLTMSTRAPEIDVLETRTTRSVTTRNVTTRSRSKCPIAQTFFIKENMTRGAEALYLGKIDLYFKRKSPTNGVSVQIREVENGYPAWEILPFGKKHLKSSEVSVSDDGTVATSIIFDAPVRLDAEKEYCFVIQPDADDPDYLTFIQKAGGLELTTGTPINQDWGDGVLFTSTNNRSWTAYQDEDIKFDLYRYNYNIDVGTVELETRENEFFDISNNVGTFSDGELVYALRGATTYSVTLTADSRTITGTGLSNYNIGDYFLVDDGSTKQLFRVISDISDTEITVDTAPLFTGTYPSNPVVAGEIIYYNPRKPDFLILEKSSARENRLFVVGDVLRNLDGSATAEISTIKNPELSYIQAMVNRITDSDTNVKVSVRAVDPLNVNDTPYVSSFDFANKKLFNERGCILYSRSNDLDSEKNLKLILTLEKDSIPTVSPIVDTETAKLFAYIYNITNDADTSSRYISKKVELKEGFDAEDFRIYLTGYRPIGTDIEVYIKVRNSNDPVSLKNNEWIKLEKTEGESLFSSTANVNDYKEFVFEIADTDKTDGILTYSNETGTYQTYRSFAIRIDLLSDNVASVPKVSDYRGIAFE